MAVFGKEIESTFLKLHQARRNVEVAAQMLAEQVMQNFEPRDESTAELYRQLRRDLWDHGNFEKEKNEVSKLLEQFEQELEAVARPAVNQK